MPKRGKSSKGATRQAAPRTSAEDILRSRKVAANLVDAARRKTPPVAAGPVVALSDSLNQFWRSAEHREGIVALWRRLSSDERRNLLLSVCPYLPSRRGSTRTTTGEDVHGAAWLTPEMALKEMGEDPSVLLQLMEHRATTDLQVLEEDDLAHVMDQVKAGKFSPPAPRPRSIYVRSSCGYSTKKMEIHWNRMDRDGAVKMQHMLDSFAVVDSDIYNMVLMRKQNIDGVLAAVADEYLTAYSDKGGAPWVSAPLWGPDPANMTIIDRVLAFAQGAASYLVVILIMVLIVQFINGEGG